MIVHGAMPGVCTYIGETDSQGRACGRGVIEDISGKSLFTAYEGSRLKYEGTFLNDKLEGTCVITIDNKDKLIAEFKDGKYHGKSTYYHEGMIRNSTGR